MMREIKDNLCTRAGDLVAYLYGEATRSEAEDFEKHARQCASCRTELSDFGGVREAIGDWRQSSLGSIASPAFDGAASPLATRTRTRSALAALREFFTLSPAWMRASVAAISLVFCVLVAIAVAYFVRQPQVVVMEKAVKSGYTDEEVQAKIAEAIKKQQEAPKSVPAPNPDEVTLVENKQPERRVRVEGGAPAASQTAKNNRRTRAVAPRDGETSSEVAAADYLPFTASGEEEHLPTLVDIVNDDE